MEGTLDVENKLWKRNSNKFKDSVEEVVESDEKIKKALKEFFSDMSSISEKMDFATSGLKTF